MTEEHGNDGTSGSGSKKKLLMVAAVAVVAVLVVAVLLIGLGSGSTKSLVTGAADTTKLLGAADMGQGWKLNSNYTTNYPAPNATNVMKGLNSSGAVALERTNGDGNTTYMLTIEIGIFDSIENAEAGYANVSGNYMQSSDSPGVTLKNVTVGDGGMLFSVKDYWNKNNTTAQVLFFRERNVVCIMAYGPWVDNMTVTEQDIIDVANKQIAKL